MVKRWWYQTRPVQTVNRRPVIVVGNINVGGTGKTPFISWLVEVLRANGIRAGIVARGYRAQLKIFPHRVVATDRVEMIGDEAYMQFRKLSCPIVIGADRNQAIELLSQTVDIDVIISDDGLQHYRMPRELEIIMLDGKRVLGNRLILPFGPLREPAIRLRTTDFLVCTGGEKSEREKPATLSLKDSAVGELENSLKLDPLPLMSLVSDAVIHLKSGQEIDLARFKQKKCVAVSGIGHPARFLASLKAVCEVTESKLFADHHPFCAEDFRPWRTETIIMTEKDAVKCFSFAEDNWYYLRVRAEVSQDFEVRLVARIARLIEQFSLNERLENEKRTP